MTFRTPRFLHKTLNRHRRGAVSFEAILVLPVVFLMGGVITQSMLLAQNRAYVEQAAYAAARSALVHKCPLPDYVGMLKAPWTLPFKKPCVSKPSKWDAAARWALVSAAPSSDFAMARNNCPSAPKAGLELLTGHPDLRNLDTAIKSRICYAFEPDNVKVEVRWKLEIVELLADILSGDTKIGSLPIEATVTFNAPLTTPIQRLLAQGERKSDGTRWRRMTATVVLQ